MINHLRRHISEDPAHLLRLISCFALLLQVSTAVLCQTGSIRPPKPKAGEAITLRYDATLEAAALAPDEGVYATVRIVVPSGYTNLAVQLQPSADGGMEGTTELPRDAVHLTVSFASRRAVDSRATLRSLIYDQQGAPVQGSRVHGAIRQRAQCLDILTAELQAFPDSHEAFRFKWAYLRLFRSGQFELDEIEQDLAILGNAETPNALLARVYLNMLCGKEEPARAALLQALKIAPTTWATATAAGDYDFFVRSGVGTAAGRDKVDQAVRAAMTAHPDSYLVRQHLYTHWGQFDTKSVKDFVTPWLQREPLNPLPHAILAASCLVSQTDYEVGSAAASRAINGLLNGDGRIASLETQGLEGAYLPWAWIVAAKLAQERGDAAAAIAYSKAYVDCGYGDGIAGYECEAQTWEQLHNPQRARERWLDALANGSTDANAALRRLWPDASGSDEDFETYLGVQLLARRPPNEREKAPSFACVDMAGKDASRDALRGRVVVLNFWGLGCTPCKLEIPSLNELANTYADRPVEFLAISSDRAEHIAAYTKNNAFAYRQIAGAGDILDAFDVQALPLHVVLDESGRIVARFEGKSDSHPARLAALIDMALAER